MEDIAAGSEDKDQTSMKLREKDFTLFGLGMVRLGRSFSMVRTLRSHRRGRRFKSGPAHQGLRLPS